MCDHVDSEDDRQYRAGMIDVKKPSVLFSWQERKRQPRGRRMFLP